MKNLQFSETSQVTVTVYSLSVDISLCAAAEESETENSALVVGVVPHRTDQCQASVELYHPMILVCCIFIHLGVRWFITVADSVMLSTACIFIS